MINYSVTNFLPFRRSWVRLLVIILLLVFLPQIKQGIAALGADQQILTKGKAAYEVVSFGRLYFHYKPPMDVELPDGNIAKGAKTPMKAPQEIMALKGRKVAIKGYVVPIEVDGNTVKTFLFADELVTCIFCQMLGFDQWIYVNANDPKGFLLKDEEFEEPMILYGTLEVGEEYKEGRLVSLYRVNAEYLEAPRKKILGIL